MANTSPTWKIEGAHQLSGSITTKGSKNTNPVILTNIPRINDVFDMVSLLRLAGTSVTWLDRSTLEIQRPSLLAADGLDIEASRRTRAVVLLVAALAKDQDDSIFPRGCSFGDHSLRPQVDALEQLSLEVDNHSAACECVGRKPASQILSCRC
jgi:UDP-N-acetylglucosamine enolpyruvyl transferase